MDHQTEPGEQLAENPKSIWLAPRCNVDERTWREDDIGCCDECGEPTVKYRRADLVDAEIDRLTAEVTEWKHAARVEAGLRREFLTRAEAAEAEIAKLRAALRPFAEVALEWDGEPPSLCVEFCAYDNKISPCALVEDFRQARRAFEQI